MYSHFSRFSRSSGNPGDVFKSSNHTAEVLDLDSIKMSCTISHAPIGFVNLL